MDQKNKITDLFKNMLGKQNKKKLVENTIIIIIIGVIIIIAGSTFLDKGSKKNTVSDSGENVSVEASKNSVSSEDKKGLEEELEAILGKIEGVGRVDVMITFVSDNEIVPAYDIKKNDKDTLEKDSNGGTRDISENDYESKIVYEDFSGGSKKPVIIKNLYPVVKGVVVVAEGASDPGVKERISRAVQVLMDIPIHKVQVFERKR